MIIYYSNMGADDLGSGVPMFGTTEKIPILVSFYGIKKNYVKPRWVSKLMLDSGAFSAWRLKVTIDLDDYLAYCHANKDKFDVMVGLDVVNDPTQSRKNFQIMKREGLNVMPVYHIAEPLSYLYKYADECKYIGIGGIAWIKNQREKHSVLRKIFRTFPNPAEIGFHGLGIHSPPMIQTYPWISVDARSAHFLARYGTICTPWGAYRVLNTHSKAAGLKPSEWLRGGKKDVVFSYLRSMGIDTAVLQEETVPGKVERCKVNACYYEQLRATCPERYIERVNTLL